MANLSELDSIIFDLGGVIVNLDSERTIRALSERVPRFNPSTFNGKETQQWYYSDYETGKISSDEFISVFNEEHRVQLSREEFEHAWNQMILDFPGTRIELIRKLRKMGKRVFLLSNTNEMHEEYFTRAFHMEYGHHFDELFDRAFYSHKLGLRKPHEEIFQKVLELSGAIAERTLFIDDSEQHVRGAKKTGLQGIHLKKPMTIEEVFLSASE